MSLLRTTRPAVENVSNQPSKMPVTVILELKLHYPIFELDRRNVSWGRQLLCRQLRVEDLSLTHRRLPQICSEKVHQQHLPARRKRSRLTTIMQELLQAASSHRFFAIKHQFAQTKASWTLRFLTVVDEDSRIFMAFHVRLRYKADVVIDTFDEQLKLY